MTRAPFAPAVQEARHRVAYKARMTYRHYRHALTTRRRPNSPQPTKRVHPALEVLGIVALALFIPFMVWVYIMGLWAL